MNRMLNTFVARGTLIFTAAIVLIACFNLADGYTSIQYSFILEILALIVCLEILDFTFSKAEFRRRVLYLAAEFAVMYLCYLAFAWFGHWFGFSPDKLALGSAVFVFLFAAVHLYYHFELKLESREINSRLKKKNTERRM
jgi:hypothetical protein